MEFRNTLRHQWNEACLQLGLPSLTIDTSAKIMAVLYQYGNNEAMVFNYHFVADCEYIQKRFHIQGGEHPMLSLWQSITNGSVIFWNTKRTIPTPMILFRGRSNFSRICMTLNYVGRVWQ